MMPQSLNFEIKNQVGYVTFTTPERLNSIDEARLSDLADVVTAINHDTELKAVVFTGVGKAFCVGLDKDLLVKAFGDMPYFVDIIRRYNEILLKIEDLPIPTIASINGFARAGGIELALVCDLIVISNSAKIGDNHTHFGVMPGGGSTQRLPRRIGEQRAKELIWTAKWLSGSEAVEYGLALKSVPSDQLASEIEKILSDFRKKPRAVLEVVKRTIHQGRGLPIEQAIEIEIEAFSKYMSELPFAREGFNASIENREPSWASHSLRNVTESS